MMVHTWRKLKSMLVSSPADEHDKWLRNRLEVKMDFDDPRRFDLVEYQKEALLILVTSAYEARMAWNEYYKQPNDQSLEQSYHTRRNIYTYNVETFQLAHQVFKDLEIHWSRLPDFIKKWQGVNPTS